MSQDREIWQTNILTPSQRIFVFSQKNKIVYTNKKQDICLVFYIPTHNSQSNSSVKKYAALSWNTPALIRTSRCAKLPVSMCHKTARSNSFENHRFEDSFFKYLGILSQLNSFVNLFAYEIQKTKGITVKNLYL